MKWMDSRSSFAGSARQAPANPFDDAGQAGVDDGFGSATENVVLRDRIRDEIERTGPITFRRFMERALYEPGEGYYHTRQAIGVRGDYLTSPELHPLFGALIARQLTEMWERLGRPPRFRLLEAGAGSGALARAILTQAGPPPFRAAIEYVIVEPSDARAAQQRFTLGALAERCSWVRTLADARAPAPGCVLSNELLDSFPVHRVRVKDGKLEELYVDCNGGRFVDRAGPPSSPGIVAYFDRLGFLPGEDCEAEVNLEALAWQGACSVALERGFALTLDYGYPARQLYAPWRRQGTLLCAFQHTAGTDPYVHIGRQDITAHVDFTSVARAGSEHGLAPVGFTTQQRFLANLGAAEALAGGPASAPSLEEYLARRHAVEALLDTQGLGRVRVLLQAKGSGALEVAAGGLRGLAGAGIEELG